MGESTRGRHSQTKAQKKDPNSLQNSPQFELQNGTFQGLQNFQFICQSPFKEMVNFEAFLMGESTRGRYSQRKTQKKDSKSTRNNPLFELQTGGFQQNQKEVTKEPT